MIWYGIEPAVAADERHRREWRQRGRQHHRAGTGPAAAMRCRKCFVQIDVHRIDAEIAKFTPDLPAVYTNDFVKAALQKHPLK